MSLEAAIQENTAALQALLAHLKSAPLATPAPTPAPKAEKAAKAEKPAPAPAVAEDPPFVPDAPVVDVAALRTQIGTAITKLSGASPNGKQLAIECFQRFGATRISKKTDADKPLAEKFYPAFLRLVEHCLAGGTTEDFEPGQPFFTETV